jgi:hypothetical protein
VSVTTDGAGNATAAELPLGLYLITETAVPGATALLSPFLVTVPITDPENLSTWLYTVNVYPKSEIRTPTTQPPTPSSTRVAATPAPTQAAAIPTFTPWPGAFVHTGGAVTAAIKWMGEYWAEVCALIADLAGGAAATILARRRRRPLRAR